MWHEERLLIEGELVEAEGGRTFETIDPASGEVLGTAADASVADAGRAVASSRRAFDDTAWATDVDLRLRSLRQLHEALVDHQDELRQLVVAEVGAPVMLTEGPQLDAPVEMVRWYADQLEKYEFTHDLGAIEVRGEMHDRWIEKEAVGVVAGIVPYNFPIQISLAKLAPALAAGCTVVLKGPPDTPWITATLGRIIAEKTDIPAGVVNVLTGAAPEVGASLVTDPRVDMVSFTGSTATGRSIMAAASDTVKKVFLELGGKSAFVVLDDADIALATMFAGFTICRARRTGLCDHHQAVGAALQVRRSTRRCAVDDGRHPIWRSERPGHAHGTTHQRAPSATRSMGTCRPRWPTAQRWCSAVGSPSTCRKASSTSRRCSSTSNRRRASRRKRCSAQCWSCCRTTTMTTQCVSPTTRSSACPVRSTAPTASARSVARRLRIGTVSVNGGMYYAPDAPFGGYKQSGIGREMGIAGLEEYLEVKTLAQPTG